jgi:hypothetical protein
VTMRSIRARTLVHQADGGRRSGDLGGLVDAPYLTQRVAGLPHGRLGAQRLAERDEKVLRAGRGLLQIGDPALPLAGVARAAQPSEPLRLILLDGSKRSGW